MSLFGIGVTAHHPNIPLCQAAPLPFNTNSLQKSIKNTPPPSEMSNAHPPLYTIPNHYSFLLLGPTSALTTHIDEKPEKDTNIYPTITSETPEKTFHSPFLNNLMSAILPLPGFLLPQNKTIVSPTNLPL